MTKLLPALTLLLSILVLGMFVAAGKEQGFSKIVFYVDCYDVGKSALEGLKGVNKVTSGFRGFREVNTVYYDQNIVTPEEMTRALQAAGTYRGRAE